MLMNSDVIQVIYHNWKTVKHIPSAANWYPPLEAKQITGSNSVPLPGCVSFAELCVEVNIQINQSVILKRLGEIFSIPSFSPNWRLLSNICHSQTSKESWWSIKF